ncbi:MAG: DUF1186 domain-containing protein [Ardenticatenaceae bacterium]
MSENRIAEIVKAFEFEDEIYKRAEIDAAIELQEEITPHLIAILEDMLVNTSKYLANQDYIIQMYVLVLLAHFKERASHQVIVDLFSLPGEIPDKLFGDMKTEILPALLLKTCDGDLELIKSFILNKEANQYCRGAGLEAIMFAVADGIISREEALPFFASLFTGNEDAEGSIFWSILAVCVRDLYPEELMDVIRQGYEDELISPFFIAPEEFRRTLIVGKEQTLRRLQDKLRRQVPDNVHDYISSWPCFKQDEPSPFDLAILAAAESKKRSRKSVSSPNRTPSSRKSSPKKAASKKGAIPNISKIAKRKKKKSRASRKKKKRK